MTQEEKDLIIKDLCARLPYGVQMNHIADNEVSPVTLLGIDEDYIILKGKGGYSYVTVEHYKPYLFPLSSMTEEQKKEFHGDVSILNAFIDGSISLYENEELTPEDIIEIFDFLNRNHFDYRGLIEKGLALDATGLNIY